MASGTCKRNVLGQQKLQNKAADVECDGIGRNGRENKRRCGHGSRFRVRDFRGSGKDVQYRLTRQR